MTWTDERVEKLKSMWNDGKSASQIAKDLGGVTRNAVIGKVHRLGLSNRAGGGNGGHDTGGETAVIDTEEMAAGGAEDVAPAPAIEPPAREPVAEPASAEMAAPSVRLVPKEVPRPKVALVPGQPMPPQPSQSEISEEALANLVQIEKKARKLTLLQLTERTCKWPIGDPATDNFWFCGHVTAPGKPYCEAHVAVAFQPMSSRRDRRSGSR